MAKKQPEKSTDKKSVKAASKTKKAGKSRKEESEILDQEEELEDSIDSDEDNDADMAEDKAGSDFSDEEADDAEIDGDELAQDPLVKKLLNYASSKQIISWDEITEILTADVVNSPKMEGVLQILTKNNIQVMEEDELLDEDEDAADDEDAEEGIGDEESQDVDLSKNRLVAND